MNIATKATKRDSYHHGNLRTQLIEAARVLVEKKGPEQFSVSEACRVAGVSTAAPYKHFKNKEEMLQEVCLLGMQRQRAQMIEEVAPHAPGTLDRIVALGRVYVRFAQEEPGVFRLMFGFANENDDCEALEELGQGTFKLVQQEVAWCRGSDEINEQDVQRAFLLWSFVHGLSFLRIDGKLSKVDLSVDLEATLTDVAQRVLTDG
ncbi:MAG: TetR/AcrR family transcriptional regulator [Boseongicola sp.]|nr:TetR/AcrR family transcriptional regulator [Boseongicola sp.]